MDGFPHQVRARRLRRHGGDLMPKTAARCGDGLRPELQALFDRLAIDPRSELFVRHDGIASTPAVASGTSATAAPLTRLSFMDFISRQLGKTLFNLN